MSHWPSSKAKRVYKALLRIGWAEHHIIKGSSHQQLTRPGYEAFTWAFHESEEIGPKMLARIAKRRACNRKTFRLRLIRRAAF